MASPPASVRTCPASTTSARLPVRMAPIPRRAGSTTEIASAIDEACHRMRCPSLGGRGPHPPHAVMVQQRQRTRDDTPNSGDCFAAAQAEYSEFDPVALGGPPMAVSGGKKWLVRLGGIARRAKRDCCAIGMARAWTEHRQPAPVTVEPVAPVVVEQPRHAVIVGAPATPLRRARRSSTRWVAPFCSAIAEHAVDVDSARVCDSRCRAQRHLATEPLHAPAQPIVAATRARLVDGPVREAVRGALRRSEPDRRDLPAHATRSTSRVRVASQRLPPRLDPSRSRLACAAAQSGADCPSGSSPRPVAAARLPRQPRHRRSTPSRPRVTSPSPPRPPRPMSRGCAAIASA